VSAVKELALESGQNRLLIVSEEIARVAVADPNVADLKVVTPTQLLLTARGPGNTDLTLWNRANQPLVVALRVARNLDGLRKQLKELFPGENVKLSAAGDLLVLEGQVSDVRIPERIGEVARLHSKQVANLLQVTGQQQVQLEVRFAEVSRSALREMGVHFFHEKPGTRVAGMTGPGTSPGAFLNSGNASVPGTGGGGPPDVLAPMFSNAFSLFFSQNFSGFPFSVTLNLLAENDLAKILAEPTLVTLTGQEAKFLAGGEMPIPVSSALGQVNVTWKKFGILLNFTPTVIGQDTIHLKLATEVSEPDPTLAVTVAGSTIPGFASRQGETTVRLGDGQSFAIAGLLSDRSRSQVAKVPLLGSIPVLGALFRSTAYRRDETELLVVVTARLVHPVAPHELPPLPTDEVRPPSDWQIFLLGMDQGLGKPPQSGPAGAVGFLR
jgi:pilus assembly protein CpaC